MGNKKSIKLLGALVFILVIAVAGALYLLFTFKTDADKAKEKIAALETEIEANKQFVYVAKENLTAGTVISEDNIVVQNCISALPSNLYVSDLDMGKVLVVDVLAQQPIMANMVTDEIFANDTREMEVGVATLMLDQSINDYVDIRIMFPDGSDYTVIPKLKIKNLNLENNLFYSNLSADEILTLSAATIDAYTITGTKIYLARYVQPNQQDEAIPNYPVRQETLLLMATDPNILTRAEKTLNAQARAELEARLALLTEEQLIAVSEGHGLVDTAHANAYVAQSQQNASLYTDENSDAGVTKGTEEENDNLGE